VGARGGGGFAHLLVGSVADQLSAHGCGPIVVVREPQPAGGPVLVGVDASEPAARALAYAADEAAQRDTGLIVLHAYAAPSAVDAEQLLADLTAAVRTTHPHVPMQLRPVHADRTDQAMIDASAEAVLTVVGCRGLGGLRSVLLGSTSRALTHHAHSPVAVVHQPGRATAAVYYDDLP
jgi:nucleotide-binding universal stress UspA family protein